MKQTVRQRLAKACFGIAMYWLPIGTDVITKRLLDWGWAYWHIMYLYYSLFALFLVFSFVVDTTNPFKGMVGKFKKK
jgi:hypothetical protein